MDRLKVSLIEWLDLYPDSHVAFSLFTTNRHISLRKQFPCKASFNQPTETTCHLEKKNMNDEFMFIVYGQYVVPVQ